MVLGRNGIAWETLLANLLWCTIRDVARDIEEFGKSNKASSRYDFIQLFLFLLLFGPPNVSVWDCCWL